MVVVAIVAVMLCDAIVAIVVAVLVLLLRSLWLLLLPVVLKLPVVIVDG